MNEQFDVIVIGSGTRMFAAPTAADSGQSLLRPTEDQDATGNCAGAAFSRVVPGPGATIGQGLNYGSIAARHAAGLL